MQPGSVNVYLGEFSQKLPDIRMERDNIDNTKEKEQSAIKKAGK
jgi:hypothetical protein